MSLFVCKKKPRDTVVIIPPDQSKIDELERELIFCGSKPWLQNRKRDIQVKLVKERKSIEKKQGVQSISKKPYETPAMVVRSSIRRSYKGDICEQCGIHLRIVNNNSMLACFKCFKTRVLPAISHAMHQEDEYSSSSIHTPQKNRLLEWLEFSQAKDYADPDETTMNLVLSNFLSHPRGKDLLPHVPSITEEYIKNGPYTTASDAINRLQHQIPDLKQLLLNITADSVDDVMRQIVVNERRGKGESLSMKYERSPKVASYLSGYWPRRFSADQEETIRRMFSESSPIYDRLKKPNQPNFPGGYASWLRSTVILLGLDEFINHFRVTLTSSRAGWNEKETIRQTVCKELNWQFIPTADTPSTIILPDGSTLASKLEQPRSTTNNKKQRIK